MILGIFFSWFLVFFVGFGCSLPVLGVLSLFWVFPAGFGCFRPVFGVLCQFWVFSAGFLCSRLVLSVFGWFWVFSTGFECSRPCNSRTLASMQLCQNFGSILTTKEDERSSP